MELGLRLKRLIIDLIRDFNKEKSFYISLFLLKAWKSAQKKLNKVIKT